MSPALKTHCKRGHAFDKANTIVKHVRGGRVWRQCRTCHNDNQRPRAVEKNKRYAARHPERFRKLKAAQMRRWRQRNVYGIEPEQYAYLYTKQQGKCGLPSCGRPIGATDHDHKTNTFRGLLCRQCNCVLGLVNDSPALLIEMTNYLRDSLV